MPPIAVVPDIVTSDGKETRPGVALFVRGRLRVVHTVSFQLCTEARNYRTQRRVAAKDNLFSLDTTISEYISWLYQAFLFREWPILTSMAHVTDDGCPTLLVRGYSLRTGGVDGGDAGRDAASSRYELSRGKT